MRLLIATVLIGFLWSSASAQERTARTIREILNDAEESGWTVKATTSAGQVFTGRLVEVDSTFRINNAVLHEAEIIRIERRVRRVGVWPVLAGGVTLGFALNNRDPDSGCSSGCTMGAFALAGLATFITATVTASNEWRSVWSDSTERRN